MINLTPGTFSSAGGNINNIGIAFGTVIETGDRRRRQRHDHSATTSATS